MSTKKHHGESAADSKCCAEIVLMGKVGRDSVRDICDGVQISRQCGSKRQSRVLCMSGG